MRFTEKEQLEHIRLRPGMYIGRLGDGGHPKDGIYRMLQEVLNNSIEEHLQGYGKKIEVSIEDGRTVSVRDYGRGQLLEERDRSSIPCTKTIRDLFAFNVVNNIVKALSVHYEIINCRNGAATKTYYRNGVLIDKQTRNCDCEEGTIIRFTPDETFFENYKFVEDIVRSMLQTIVCLNVGLEIVFNGESMKSTDGIAELLAEKMGAERHCLYPIIHLKSESVEIALTHSQQDDEMCYSFANGLYTNLGGTHLAAFKKAVASVIMEMYPSEGFIPEDIYCGMVAAISINMEHPLFESVNMWKLGSMYFTEDRSVTIEEYVHDFFNVKFKAYLQQHADIRAVLFEKICSTMNKRVEKRTQAL